MIVLLIILAAFGVGALLLHLCVKGGGGAEVDWWGYLGVLFAGRVATRLLFWVMPVTLSPLVKLGVNYLVYSLVIVLALVFWAKVGWARALLWGFVVSAVMHALAVVAVQYVPNSAVAP